MAIRMTLWTYIIFKIWGYPYMETRCRVNVVYIIISSVYNIKKISIIFQIFCIFPPHLIFIPCWRWIPLVFLLLLCLTTKMGQNWILRISSAAISNLIVTCLQSSPKLALHSLQNEPHRSFFVCCFFWR